jgi:hypothetical protein
MISRSRRDSFCGAAAIVSPATSVAMCYNRSTVTETDVNAKRFPAKYEAGRPAAARSASSGWPAQRAAVAGVFTYWSQP